MLLPKSLSPRRRALPLLLSLIGGAVLIVGLLVLNRPQMAVANSDDMANAISQYPAIDGTRLDACGLCHTSQRPALNAYGADYNSHGRDDAAFATIESLDSDGDGFTNLEEIQALSFPGSASDVPQATPQPTSQPTPQPTPTVGGSLSIRLFIPVVVK